MPRQKKKNRNTRHRVNPKNVNLDRLLPSPAKKKNHLGKSFADTIEKAAARRPQATPPARPARAVASSGHAVPVEQLELLGSALRESLSTAETALAILERQRIPEEVQKRIKIFLGRALFPQIIAISDKLFGSGDVTLSSYELDSDSDSEDSAPEAHGAKSDDDGSEDLDAIGSGDGEEQPSAEDVADADEEDTDGGQGPAVSLPAADSRPAQQPPAVATQPVVTSTQPQWGTQQATAPQVVTLPANWPNPA